VCRSTTTGALFELLILEGAQAGLSWSTILAKRENYRPALDGFDAEKIARYDAKKVAALLADPGIVRNRLKIAATIGNARAYLVLHAEPGGFDRFLWSFVGGQPIGEPPQRSRAGAHAHTGERRPEQGPARARFQIRRHDHLLRLHAGLRHGR